MLPEELPQAVIGKNGDVTQTFLVDGIVAGSWSGGQAGQGGDHAVRAAPAHGATRRSRSEAARLEAWLRSMYIGAHLSSAGGIHTAVDRAGGDRRRVAAGLHAEPARLAADEPRSGELRPLPRAARRGRAARRPLPRALPLQPRRAERRGLREVDRGAAQHDGGRVRDRRRRRRLPRRLASRLRLRARPRARPAGDGAGARADDRRDLAPDGELGRRRRHDRPLDRRARDDLRAARPPSAARRLPRLLPSLRLRRRRDRSRSARRSCSTTSTRRSGSTVCARCT